MQITVNLIKRIQSTGFNMEKVAVICVNREHGSQLNKEITILGDEFKVSFSFTFPKLITLQ